MRVINICWGSETPGIGWWQSGNVWSAMANHDHYANTKTFETQVVDNIQKAWSLYTNFDQFQ